MSRPRNYYDWDGVIEQARRRPLVWLPMFPNHPASLAEGIRVRRSAALQREDGHLEATIVNRYQYPGFAARGDIWVRWVPHPNPTTD